ncbi:MAG: hypothetical protein WCL07_00160 [bacterium]
MKKYWLIIWILIFAFGAIVRFFQFTSRSPFDWDQNRDYAAVASIVSGKPTLLGPIAKGDNGFYIGPLYYYLLVPGYIVSKGNPISFPITSITIDLLGIALLIYLAYRRSSERQVATIIAGIWSISWFCIENSRVSWNVALLFSWMAAMYVFATMRNNTNLRIFCYGLVAGLAWHIHASLLPLSIILPVFFLPQSTSRIKSYLLFCVGYFVPLIPLLAFDLRHAFFNLNLMLNFVSTQNDLPHSSITSIIIDVIAKLGRNTMGIIGGPLRSNVWVGIAVMMLALWGLFTRRRTTLWASVIIFFNFIFVVALRDLRFPEYYLAASYLPVLILLFNLRIKFVIPTLALLLIAFFNISSYSIAPSPYSLANKILLTQKVSSLKASIDARYELSPGREGGIVPLLQKAGVTINQSADTKIIFTDKLDGQVTIGSMFATDLIRIGGLRAAIYKVQ